MSDANTPSGDEVLAAKMAAGFEGFSATAYLDTLAKPPVWTVGFGSIWKDDGTPVTEGFVVTRDQAVEMLSREMRKAVINVAAECKVPLTTNMRAALEDFIYNLGIGAFDNSTLLRKLNNKDYEGAAQEFDKWDHAGGVEVAGLLRRREAEKALFLQGMGAPAPSTGNPPPPSATPVATTTPSPAPAPAQGSFLQGMAKTLSDIFG